MFDLRGRDAALFLLRYSLKRVWLYVGNPPYRQPMNPTYHRPLEVELEPVSLPAPLKNTQNLFTLRMRYRPGGRVHSYVLVYIPKSLQIPLLSGDVRGIHLETFEHGSRAHNHLPDAFSYLILGVKTKSGVELSEVPRELRRGWWLDSVTGLVACLIGAALFSGPYAWAGALCLLFGSHRLRDAFTIPRKPFWTNKEVY